MNKQDYQFYISGAIKLGVSFGIVSLLARWVTGNTILSSPETLLKYGMVGGIGYSLMGALSLILFGMVAKRIRQSFPHHLTIGDVLRQKLNPSGYWYMICILLITSLDSIFVQAMGAAILLHIVFPIPIYLGMLLFLFVCYLIGGMGGMQRIHQLASVNVTLIFAAVIIIPVYFYIQNGVHPVFEGIKLYHPYLLYFQNTDAMLFIMTAILIGFGQVIIDRSTWQRVFLLKPAKVQLTFTLAGFIWMTIPLALSSLLMIIIYSGSYDNITSLLFELINRIQTTLFVFLFILFCFSAISAAISSELQATTVLIVRNILQIFLSLTNRDKWNLTYLTSGFICVLLLVVVSIFSPSLLELLFFFGHMYASLIIPMLYIILSKGPIHSIIPFSSLIGMIGGYAFISVVGNFTAIWISFFISGTLCSIVWIYTIFNNHFNK
ncbi:hypothetical protein LG276_03820 [Cytobacillus kochii]|uniref:hypothetical protein n=1 Tax=Cytobacillus kochii TaxID=859143 RepID=UPI00384E0901